jgi:hypothetical protein
MDRHQFLKIFSYIYIFLISCDNPSPLLELGKEAFNAPMLFVCYMVVGLKYEHRVGEGKVLVRDEPLASIIEEGMRDLHLGHI